MSDQCLSHKSTETLLPAYNHREAFPFPGKCVAIRKKAPSFFTLTRLN